jgi:hypothetical protein
MFIKGCLTASYYRKFLENELPLYLEDVHLALQGQMWLQNDGALPHFGTDVMGFLNENYEGRWVGKNELVAWPAGSPDLNQLDLCLLGRMKSRVYHSGTPEGRCQLVDTTNEASVGIRNKLRRMQ